MADVVRKIDELVAKGRKSADVMKEMTQEQVDKICAAMDAASVANEQKLAEMAVEETGIGRADHKAIKNHLGAHIVYEYFKDKKSVGIIKEESGVKYVAEPFGVIAAATPTTITPLGLAKSSAASAISPIGSALGIHVLCKKRGSRSSMIALDVAWRSRDFATPETNKITASTTGASSTAVEVTRGF